MQEVIISVEKNSCLLLRRLVRKSTGIIILLYRVVGQGGEGCYAQ